MFVIVTLRFVMVRRTSVLLYVMSEVVLFSRTERSFSCVNALIVLSSVFVLLFNHLEERCDWQIALFSS